MLDLNQLKTFRAVAKAKHFTRAASDLAYAQSTVTAQVQALERALGVPVFDRIGKRIALTDAGARLLDYAERLLDLAEEAQNAVQPAGPPRGVLTVSAHESILTYRLPRLLRLFQSRYREVQLRLSSDAETSSGVGTLQRSTDIAFVMDEPVNNDDRISRILCEEEIVILVAPGHGLAKTARFGWEALAGHHLLLPDRSCSYCVLLERSLRAANVQQGAILEPASVEAIKHCVMARMGIAVLPMVAVTKEIKQRRLVALRWPGPRPKIYTRMLRFRRRWFSPAASALWNLAERHFGVT